MSNIDAVRNQLISATEIKKHLIPLAIKRCISESDFYRITSLLTPQSRSSLWEKYFILKHKCCKINLSEDRGDFEKNGIYYEYKSSGYNLDSALHVVQVRLWQTCDYLIQSISDDAIATFHVPHKNMSDEVEKLNASVAHGTKTANKENKNIELRFTVKKDTEHWQRWCQNYTFKQF